MSKRDRGFGSRPRELVFELPPVNAVGSVYHTTKGNFFSLLDPAVVARGLPGEAIVGELLVVPEPGAAALLPGQIRINRVFVDFLHRVIARYAPSLSEFQAEVRRQHDGFIYIMDARTATPQGEVPPEDIMGAFEVRGGQLVPDSYKACPTHQIISDRGLFRLQDALQDCLLWELEQLIPE